MVMDLVTGGELFDAVAEAGRLPEVRSRRYFQQLVDGIQYCHTRGVYHRDLKPENLLLTSDKQTLKITDFGLSSIKAHNASSELLHTILGSPHYIAPEIITSAAAGYDGAKVDVWASGIILFGMLAGYLPFDEPTTRALYSAIVHNAVSYPAHFSYDVIKLLRAMLQKDPTKRPTMEQIKSYAWFKVNYQPAMFLPDSSKPTDSLSRKKTKYRLKKNAADKSAKHRKRDSGRANVVTPTTSNNNAPTWKENPPCSTERQVRTPSPNPSSAAAPRVDHGDGAEEPLGNRENVDPVLTADAPRSPPTTLSALVIASSDSCKTASSASLGPELSAHPPPDPVYRLPSRRSVPRLFDAADNAEHAAAVPLHVEPLEPAFSYRDAMSTSFTSRPRHSDRERGPARPPPYAPDPRDSFGPDPPTEQPHNVVADARISELKSSAEHTGRASMVELFAALQPGEDSTYSGGHSRSSRSSRHSMVGSEDGQRADRVGVREERATRTSAVMTGGEGDGGGEQKKKGTGDAQEAVFISPVSVNAEDVFGTPKKGRRSQIGASWTSRNREQNVANVPESQGGWGTRDRAHYTNRGVPTLQLEDDTWGQKNEALTPMTATNVTTTKAGTGFWTSGTGTSMTVSSGIFKPVKSVFAPLAERLLGQDDKREMTPSMLCPWVDSGTGTNEWCLDSGEVFADVEAEDGNQGGEEEKKERVVRKGRRSMLGFGRNSGKIRRSGGLDGSGGSNGGSKPIFGELSSDLAVKLGTASRSINGKTKASDKKM